MEEYIGTSQIYYGILSGSEKICNNREELNNSNGFPVPDRDTGNNLSYLMHHILRESSVSDSIKDMLEKISTVSIRGARGNSGAIFSQFFYGFSQHAPSNNRISLKELANCFSEGYQYAYAAIETPMEGTIITAIRSFSHRLNDNLTLPRSVSENLMDAFTTLKETVELTKDTLLQQKKIKKPDAGAKAFLYFMEGFIDSIIHKRDYYEVSRIASDRLEFDAHNIEEEIRTIEIRYRYCTEVLLQKKSGTDYKMLQGQMASYGDSLVISENHELLRLHIHTDYPDQVVEKMYHYGKILENKAEDMIAQKNLSISQTGKTALIIDSIADIPKEILPDFVYQLPLNLMVDDVSYLDKITTFSALLSAKSVSTSQPNVEQILAFLKPIIQRYESVLIITVSAKMSGIHHRFREVVKKIGSDKNIYLFDSKQNSVAQGLVSRFAIEKIKQGLDVQEVYRQLEGVISRSRIYVCLPNLKRMVASGRLNERIGKFFQWIGFLPLITINEKGEGTVEGLAFSKEANERILLQKIKALQSKIEDYAIVHADCIDRAESMATRIEEILNKKPVYIDRISTVVMQYSGVGSIAVGYILKEKTR